MNSAYKHLEARLKIAELTITQWAGVIFGVLLGLAWGMYLSPFGSYVTLFTAIYVGGIPALIAFLASQTEFDLFLRVRSMARWRRGTEHYVPGPGTHAGGYAVAPEARSERERLQDQASELDFAALWD